VVAFPGKERRSRGGAAPLKRGRRPYFSSSRAAYLEGRIQRSCRRSRVHRAQRKKNSRRISSAGSSARRWEDGLPDGGARRRSDGVESGKDKRLLRPVGARHARAPPRPGATRPGFRRGARAGGGRRAADEHDATEPELTGHSARGIRGTTAAKGLPTSSRSFFVAPGVIFLRTISQNRDGEKS